MSRGFFPLHKCSRLSRGLFICTPAYGHAQRLETSWGFSAWGKQGSALYLALLCCFILILIVFAGRDRGVQGSAGACSVQRCQIPWSWRYRQWWPSSCGWWEPCSSPLGWEYLLLTAEHLSLQPLWYHIWSSWWQYSGGLSCLREQQPWFLPVACDFESVPWHYSQSPDY